MRLAVLTIVLVCCVSVGALAQGKVDVVTLANGDRITGEVKNLDRGRLEFSTDDAGTLYLEWDKLARLVAATRLVEVVTTDGRRFLGTLVAAPSDRTIAVNGPGGPVPLLMSDVLLITPIGRSFWTKLDGSIDVGFSYTKSSGVSQLNMNSDTLYRRPGFQARLTASLTSTTTSDGSGDDDRGAVEGSYLRYPWQRWFVAASTRFESNQSLGLDLRSQVGGVIGPRLVTNNHQQLAVGAGLAFNDEQGVDVEATQNLEGLFLFRSSYFKYDSPKTNLDLNLQYYPSLSNWGRNRLQLDAAVKRELLKDFTVSLSLYDSFDSRPPNTSADKNDIGIVLSLGWTY